MLPPKRSTRTSISLKRGGEIEIIKAMNEDGIEIPDAANIPDGKSTEQAPAPQVGAVLTVDTIPEGEGEAISQKKTRRKLTDEQRGALEGLAEREISPSLETRRILADQIGLLVKLYNALQVIE